jgi:hypothetical protein
LSSPEPISLQRAAWFTGVLLLIAAAGDGWSGKPGGITHQLLLLPITASFLCLLWLLLFGRAISSSRVLWTPSNMIGVAVLLELVSGALFLYESQHFTPFGYRSHPVVFTAVVMVSCSLLVAAARRRSHRPAWIFSAAVVSFTAGRLVSVLSFPLNYLRSDMLPVIVAADQRVLHHGSPYSTLFLGPRPYAFPYLPGMIVAYLPFTALHLDPRLGGLVYLLAAASLFYWAARPERRLDVALLLALFLLSPFLQYRHDLYLQPHWFTLALAFVLMHRGRFAWAAFVFGVSMAVYQFSWILFPFLLLNGLRRRGWPEALKLALLGALGALVIAGPFLPAAARRIASNTVSQWGELPHALADPMNLSYWASFLIPAHRLLVLQAGLMIAIFAVCILRGRCADLADTLRWMSFALTVFVLFNVIVDGYFFLMILVVLLAYTCSANGWWVSHEGREARAA